jgi:hypothetical protein
MHKWGDFRVRKNEIISRYLMVKRKIYFAKSVMKQAFLGLLILKVWNFYKNEKHRLWVKHRQVIAQIRSVVRWNLRLRKLGKNKLVDVHRHYIRHAFTLFASVQIDKKDS